MCSYTQRFGSRGCYLWANYDGTTYTVVFIDSNWNTKYWEGNDSRVAREKWFEFGHPLGVAFTME